MVNISNNGFISVHRGDSFKVPLFINEGTKDDPVRLYIKNHPQASVYLGVMEPNQRFEEAIIKKRYSSDSSITSSGDLYVKFRPSDTEYLLPGLYYYSVKAEVTQMQHNVNYDMTGTAYILVYGWENDYTNVTVADLQARFPRQTVVDIIGVNRFTNQPVNLYAISNYEETQLDVYATLDSASGELTNHIATIELADLCQYFKSTQSEVIVDTIVPPTEFMIFE